MRGLRARTIQEGDFSRALRLTTDLSHFAWGTYHRDNKYLGNDLVAMVGIRLGRNLRAECASSQKQRSH